MGAIIDSIFNFLFGWAVAISPLVGIIFVSFVLSLLSTLSWKYLTDQILLKELREKTKALHAQVKNNKDNPAKLKEINSKMAKENLESLKLQYKQSIKPMIATLIPFAFAFSWIRNNSAFQADIFLSFGGVGSYIIFSIIFSMILRKAMKVY